MSISTKVNHKADINAFMVNGTLDLFELDRIKFFVGAGIGGTQLKEKISITSTLNLSGKNIVIVDQSVSSKKANNFAYSFTAGTSAKVTDRVTFELAYAWKDFGKTKSVKIQGVEVGKTPYRSHTLTAGVRVDI
jgi:opacity protein-like surface antigen